MLGERLAQGQDATSRGVADEGVLVSACERAAQEARPDVVGKGVRRDAAFGKADEVGGGAGVDNGHWRLLLLRRQCLLLDFGYVIATLGQRIDIALDDELGISVFNGDDADAEVFRQCTLRRQLVAGVQRTACDVALDALIKMRVHALALEVGKAVGKHEVFLSEHIKSI